MVVVRRRILVFAVSLCKNPLLTLLHDFMKTKAHDQALARLRLRIIKNKNPPPSYLDSPTPSINAIDRKCFTIWICLSNDWTASLTTGWKSSFHDVPDVRTQNVVVSSILEDCDPLQNRYQRQSICDAYLLKIPARTLHVSLGKSILRRLENLIRNFLNSPMHFLIGINFALHHKNFQEEKNERNPRYNVARIPPASHPKSPILLSNFPFDPQRALSSERK